MLFYQFKSELHSKIVLQSILCSTVFLLFQKLKFEKTEFLILNSDLSAEFCAKLRLSVLKMTKVSYAEKM